MEDLKKLMTNSGLTLTEVSKLSGIPLSTTFNYVKGQVKNMNKDFYNAIYEVLCGYNKDNVEETVEETEITNEVADEINDNSMDTNEKLFVDEKMNIQYSTEQSDELAIDVKEIKEAIEGGSLKNNYSSIHNYNTVIPSQIKRKDIWYIKNNSGVGGEIVGNRPFLVIGNEKTVQMNKTVTGVYLTKTPRAESPFHVTIKTNVMSTAICEQVNTISVDRFVNKVGEITDVELALVEKAIINALGIKTNNSSSIYHSPDYISLKTELLVYKKIYEDYIRIQQVNKMSN